MPEPRFSGQTILCLDWGQTQQELYSFWGVLDSCGYQTIPFELSFWIVTITTRGDGSFKLLHRLYKDQEIVHEYPTHTRLKTAFNKDILIMEIVGQQFKEPGMYAVKSFVVPPDESTEILIGDYPFGVQQVTVK